ncbi:S8 family serine peptidase [Luteococcus sp.]|uniref:S8 family serine peptidase n=1 Tax=Luteococcus sp. TaxID=1969402 RepID=UPI003734C857
MQHKRMVSGLAATALAVSGLCTVAPAHAQDRDLGRLSDYIRLAENDHTGQVVKNRWLVKVEGAPVVAGGSTTAATKTQKKVVDAAKRKGVRLTQQRSFSRTFNGMAVTMDAKQARKLAGVAGVTGIYPVVSVGRPVEPAGTSKPAMATAVNLTGAAVARDDLGLDGEGIKVGVIDSGIDIDHPDLGGSGTNGMTRFPTKRVTVGHDFVGDAYDADADGSVPVPDPVPDDCGGHGTHVAGIIGGDGNPSAQGVKGVAPKVTFGAYRIFGCEGSSSSEIIMAAMERAQADGMDVVNMSLGASFMTWRDYPTAVAADALTDSGVTVVVAAGNSGEDGSFSSGAPSVSKKVISVASFDNTHVTRRAFSVGGKDFGYQDADAVPVPRQGTMELVSLGAPASPQAKGCPPWDETMNAAVKGKAVLIQRGECSFHEKSLAAQKAGAVAVILYNNQPGSLTPSTRGDEPITIPVVMLSQTDGEALVAAGQGQTLTWTERTVASEDPNAGRISSFSSWGMTADLVLKPDLGAPGGNIWSTYPLEKGAYSSLSGTSMATPHVAGAVAQLMQARPELKGRPRQVQTLLQNTADHDALFALAPDLGLKESVLRQGAGMIQVDRAVGTLQRISPSSVSLGEQRAKPVTTILTLRNQSPRPAVYQLSHEGSVGAVGTSDPQFDVHEATVTMPKRVVVPPRGTAAVKVTIGAPADAPNGYLYGGWITAKSATGTTLSVPYAGMAGDYQRVDVLNAPDGTQPCLGTLVDKKPQCVDGTELSYSMKEGDRPMAVFRLEYPTERFEILVHRATPDGGKGELLGTVMQADKNGREPGPLHVEWDGTYLTTDATSYLARASKGDYVFELRALRALGKAEVAADWQTWTSPAFTARFDDGAKADPATNPVDPMMMERARS